MKLKKIYKYYIIILSLSIFHSQAALQSRNIAIFGTGYVGLITGAGLADIGHKTTCVDIDKKKIKLLQKTNTLPIHEPGLHEIVKANVENKRLSFTTNAKKAIEESEIIIIAVGTPLNDKNKADLKALKSVIKTIAKFINSYKVIVIKSTVPIGTNKKMDEFLTESIPSHMYDIVSNPEFLREGSALKDFFTINPIVLGSESDHALEIMQSIYRPLIEQNLSLLITNLQTAETIKYAWNAFSATRIMYVNELAHLCNAVGADIQTVVHGMSFSEDLLPTKKLRPGPGLGGSCLPKDTQAIVSLGHHHNVNLNIIKKVISSNHKHKKLITEQLYQLIDEQSVNKKTKLPIKTIAILGLSFKANTDDIRYSPAIPTIDELIKKGFKIKAYDPQAMSNMQKIFPEVSYCSSWQKAITDADALILLTEWEEFKKIDLNSVADYINNKIILDMRNIWQPEKLRQLGFSYKNLGRI